MEGKLPPEVTLGGGEDCVLCFGFNLPFRFSWKLSVNTLTLLVPARRGSWSPPVLFISELVSVLQRAGVHLKFTQHRST